jgi:NTP pyrophosphatase (non-canonical NTP hydrolase)
MIEDRKFIDAYTEFVKYVCECNKWKKDWSHGGCYMHLEVSELIEALRGKGDPEDELGDVLFTVIAVANHHNVDIIAAIKRNIKKHETRLKNGT